MMASEKAGVLVKVTVGLAFAQLVTLVALVWVVYAATSGSTYGSWPAPVRVSPQTTQWEYSIGGIPDLEWETQSAALGEQGWELIYARRARDDNDAMLYECIFKRPVKYGYVGDAAQGGE